MFTAKEYATSQYYEEHKAAGIDYLNFGFWHEQYVKMLINVTRQQSYDYPRVFDGGCACGAILYGLQTLGQFKAIYGMDISNHMIGLGRGHFGFDPDNLWVGSLVDIMLPKETVSLVHCSQVLEHIPDAEIDQVFAEFYRILQPGGRAFICLDALQEGDTLEQHLVDPTHINIQPTLYWSDKLHKAGFRGDVEAFMRYVRTPYRPTEDKRANFFEAYPEWAVWTLIKP
jgi:ubiquinone/menaquinone biosynthesis C-methylase UbiE